MVGEIESVAAFHAQEIAVDAALVAVVAAHNFHAGIGAAHAQSRLAAVSTVGAGSAHMLHLPWPRLVAIGTGSQRAYRADINAHAALFAFEMVFFIGGNDGTHAAVLHPQRPHVHAFATDAYAAKAQNAARPVEINHRRPLLFLAMVLDVDELRLGSAVRERHVLQFAFAAGVAHRAVERVIAQQHLDHR